MEEDLKEWAQGNDITGQSGQILVKTNLAEVSQE